MLWIILIFSWVIPIVIITICGIIIYKQEVSPNKVTLHVIYEHFDDAPKMNSISYYRDLDRYVPLMFSIICPILNILYMVYTLFRAIYSLIRNIKV